MDSNPIKELFSDDGYCKSEICKIRKLFGDRNSSLQEKNIALEVLAFMYLNCSNDMRELVLYQMKECESRINMM